MSHAPQKTAPAPVPQASIPQANNAAPAGKATITQIGTASWYGPGFHGQETASGAMFNQHALTAAGFVARIAQRDLTPVELLCHGLDIINLGSQR